MEHEKRQTVSDGHEMTYDQAVEYVLGIGRFSKKNSLKNTRTLLDGLGAPDEGFKIIHVAGTNGKGSVCGYIDSILRSAGHSVGLFTSPHLFRINERIKINGTDITDEAFLRSFLKVKSVSGRLEKTGCYIPTFFEFVFLIAMDAFWEAGIEYAVLETGLGGRLDATNAVREKEAAVITSIDLDHTEILGNTFPEIAAEKAGIIGTGAPVIYLNDKPEVSSVIENTARERGSLAISVTPGESFRAECESGATRVRMKGGLKFTLDTPALFQAENAALAVTAAEAVSSGREEGAAPGDDLRIAPETIAAAVESARRPCRMQEIMPDVYVDGAHNPAAIRGLCETISRIGKGRPAVLLFAAMKDKNYPEMIKIIKCSGCFEKIIVTGLSSERAASADELRAEFLKCDAGSGRAEAAESDAGSSGRAEAAESVAGGTIAAENAADGFARALRIQKEYGGLCVCAGSFYLPGEIRG